MINEFMVTHTHIRYQGFEIKILKTHIYSPFLILNLMVSDQAFLSDQEQIYVQLKMSFCILMHHLMKIRTIMHAP